MKIKNIFIICFLLTLFLCITGCGKIETKEFTNIEFNDMEVYFDGDYHSVYVNNLPEFASVTYEGNNQKEVGVYTVKAKVEALNYETLYLEANLTILNLNKFENIDFLDREFLYDGSIFSIYVSNLPEFARVTYEGNNQREVGVYTVKAKVEAYGYETLYLEANLIIIELSIFENIEFNDEELYYDGSYHSIYVSNLPEFASISYEGNNQKDVGVYTVIAKIEAYGYETLYLEANLTILELNKFENIEFLDQEFFYDGNSFSIYVSNLPEFARVSYEGNNQKEVGVYTVKAKIEALNYETLYLKASLSIKEKDIIEFIDSNDKFIIEEDITYDDLYNQLIKHNFLLYYEEGTEQVYNNGDTIYNLSTKHTYAFTDSMFYHYTDYVEEDEYLYDTIEFGEIVNEYVLITKVKVSNDTITYYKIPKEAFYETFGGTFIAVPFAHFEKDLDGGFNPIVMEDYFSRYSSYEVVDNEFITRVRNYIFHSEFTNSEICTYKYSNINNIIINIPSKYKANIEDVNDYKPLDFTLNGISYLCFDKYWYANIDISFYDLVLIEPKAYTVLASIYNIPVLYIYYPYYVYNRKYDGYEFNVYFNENLVYQGIYQELGEIKTKIGTSRYDAIYFFEDNGGKYNYFGSW